jgi:hypothetical protein
MYIYAAKAGLLLRALMFYFADCAIILYFACVRVCIHSEPILSIRYFASSLRAELVFYLFLPLCLGYV